METKIESQEPEHFEQQPKIFDRVRHEHNLHERPAAAAPTTRIKWRRNGLQKTKSPIFRTPS